MDQNEFESFQQEKKNLIHFMRCCGFDIDEISYEEDTELVGSKMRDCDELWWRDLSVEGSGFSNLFKHSIRDLWDKYER